jgi:hypothetical protein
MMGLGGFSGVTTAGAAAMTAGTAATTAGTTAGVDMVTAVLPDVDGWASGLSGATVCTSSNDSCEAADGLSSSAGKFSPTRSGVSGNDSSCPSILERLGSVEARYPAELTVLSFVFVEERLDGLALLLVSEERERV